MAFASSSALMSTLFKSALMYTWPPPDTFGSFPMATSVSFVNCSPEMPIFVMSFKIRLSSMVNRLYKKCSWSIC